MRDSNYYRTRYTNTTPLFKIITPRKYGHEARVDRRQYFENPCNPQLKQNWWFSSTVIEYEIHSYIDEIFSNPNILSCQKGV